MGSEEFPHLGVWKFSCPHFSDKRIGGFFPLTNPGRCEKWIVDRSLRPEPREFLVDQAVEFAFFRELLGLLRGFIE